MEFRMVPFAELSASELLDILRLRAEVFVVEQHCAYCDPDANDARSTFGLAYDGDDLAATLRVFLGKDGAFWIGRLAVAKIYRRRGIATGLLRRALGWIDGRGGGIVRLSAQVYAQGLYAGAGFCPRSDPYLEDGIRHVLMERNV